MPLTGAKAENFETGLLKYVFLGDTANVHTGSNLYVGLFTSNGTDPPLADTSQFAVHEPTAANGYKRVPVSFAFSAADVEVGASAADPASISNTNIMNFGTSNNANGWGDVTGFFITTGIGPSQGDGAGSPNAIMYYGSFDTKRTVSTGDSVRINASNLTIKEK